MPTVRPRTTLYLWEFLLQLLEGEQPCPAISWLNRERGEFVLKDQGEIAKLWGKVKGRPQMDKIKLGRAMRYYYKKKLLVKVPRRKAVYCFVKFDALKQRENQTHRIYDEVSDVDFNEDCQLDVTGLEKSNNEVLSDFDVEDESDMPLETLLTEKPEDSAMQAQKTSGSKLFHIENNRSQSQGNINGYISNSFMDGNSQGNINGYISNSFIDYNSYFYNNNNNNSICRGNSFSDARNGGFEKSNYFTSGFPQYGSVSENNNNQVSNSGTDSCVASLVYKSTLVSNDLDTQEQKASGNFQQATCGMPFENVWQPGPGTATLPTRNDDATDPTMTSSFYFDDMDFDTTLNDAFKELERLVMLNKLMET